MPITKLQRLAKLGVYTHNGVYHADDVLSTVLLKLTGVINRYADVHRVSIAPDTGLIYDIGGGDYDHHQRKDEEVCSFTLLCDELGYDWSAFKGMMLRDQFGPGKCPDSIGAVIRMAHDAGVPFDGACSMCEKLVETWLSANVLLKQKEAEIRARYDGKAYVITEEPFSSTLLRDTTVKLVCMKTERGGTISMVPPYTVDTEVDFGGTNKGFAIFYPDFESAMKNAIRVCKWLVEKEAKEGRYVPSAKEV